ncbi:hypothetical protein CONLIGDRAFT_108256 [Coniochaeta ligniaria NRRL 30616]|uniref:Uncharacterized protein n=1 Tax=Coniochaeta ligniaria NRRL 30616 TaxID=1408157 RepID=A0A1J7I9W5_9PEZI|nr:hypothetical protein CONLIGDRAFT_108256 [Coniochaeta ligniaria NRRL 30616]
MPPQHRGGTASHPLEPRAPWTSGNFTHRPASTLTAMVSSIPGAWPAYAECAVSTTEAITPPRQQPRPRWTSHLIPGPFPPNRLRIPRPLTVSPSLSSVSVDPSSTLNSDIENSRPFVIEVQRQAQVTAKARLCDLIDPPPNKSWGSGPTPGRVISIPNAPELATIKTHPRPPRRDPRTARAHMTAHIHSRAWIAC